ncbi:MAG: TraR/DksA family transcriptional regulator [Bacteroidetes bacterium]|jgi:DnaK suppressor protein|nr:TraR/DksA family transcriptional regulator [Bacteroidota bacterium]
MSEEKTHYAKGELQEFKDIIQDKLAEARQEYKTLQESLKQQGSEGGVDALNVTEMGTEFADKEQTEMLLARTGKFIDGLERALIRIENGTYGRCKVTGKLIPKERLRVVPHTETSLEAKLKQNT